MDVSVFLINCLLVLYIHMGRCQFPDGGGIGGGGGQVPQPEPSNCYWCGQAELTDSPYTSNSKFCTGPSTSVRIPTESCEPSRQCYAHTWFEGDVAHAERGCDLNNDYCASTYSCNGSDCVHCCRGDKCNTHAPTEIQEISQQWVDCYSCNRNDTSDACSEAGFDPSSNAVGRLTCQTGQCMEMTVPAAPLLDLPQELLFRSCASDTREVCTEIGGCVEMSLGSLFGFGDIPIPGVEPAEVCCCSDDFCNGPEQEEGTTTMSPVETTSTTSGSSTTQAPPTTEEIEGSSATEEIEGSSAVSITMSFMTVLFTLIIGTFLM